MKLISPSLTHTCMTRLKIQLTGGKPVGYLQSVVDLTQGQIQKVVRVELNPEHHMQIQHPDH